MPFVTPPFTAHFPETPHRDKQDNQPRFSKTFLSSRAPVIQQAQGSPRRAANTARESSPLLSRRQEFREPVQILQIQVVSPALCASLFAS